VFLVFGVPLLILLAVFAVEWLIALLALPALAAVRLALPIPWPVVARGRGVDGRRVRYAVDVAGWRASARVIEATAEDIRVHGEPRALGGPTADDDLSEVDSLADPSRTPDDEPPGTNHRPFQINFRNGESSFLIPRRSRRSGHGLGISTRAHSAVRVAVTDTTSSICSIWCFPTGRVRPVRSVLA
jgi:hypothetical protein